MQESPQEKAPQDCLTPMQDMVESHALVRRYDSHWAYLQAERKSTCASCSVSHGCGTAALASLFKDKGVDLRIENTFDAKAGERIVIGLSDHALLAASALAYMVPLAGLLLGAVVASALGYGGGISAIAGFTGLGAGFWIGARLRGPRHTRFKPVFLRRAGEAYADQIR